MASDTRNLASFAVEFQQTCESTFNKKPYSWQTEIGSDILYNVHNNIDSRLLCVRPTGGGKTLLYNTISASLKGITLCISPLLSLGASQGRKLHVETAQAKSMAAFHLDEMTETTGMFSLAALEQRLQFGTKPILLISSPQCLLEKGNALLQVLIQRRLIKFIVMDEIHLFAHYGRSFREHFGKLKGALFDNIPSNVPMLFLTATCTVAIKEAFEKLIGIRATHVHWPEAEAMERRNVKFKLKYSSAPSETVAASIIAILKSEDKDDNDKELPKKTIVYSNRSCTVSNFATYLETALDKDEDDAICQTDVLLLLGTLTKEEKTEFIRIFVNGDSSGLLKLLILCATSGVGNAGIDSPEIRAVFRLDCPPSVMDLIQELGRAGRNIYASSDNYTYTVYFSLESYLHLFERINDPEEMVLDEAYRDQQVKDLQLVASLFAMPQTCYSIKFESLLGRPNSPNPDHPCGICPFCSGSQKDLFKKLNKAGIQKMLLDLFMDSEHQMNGPKTVDKLIEAIRKYPKAPELLLSSNRKTNLQPVEIKKALFLLLASGILKLSYDKEEQRALFGLTRVSDGTILALLSDSHWNKIHTTVTV